LHTRHLDIGCGATPKNPLGAESLFGLDIRKDLNHPNILRWDAISQGIPFSDNYFSSVSCFDFLEHVPRVVLNGSGSSRFVFVELMEEIYRVLVPGGLLLAATPYFPRPEAFCDPTHVNFITPETHLYFCGDPPTARMYGFSGVFIEEMVARGLPKFLYGQTPSYLSRKLTMFHRLIKGERIPHLLWKLRVVK
jgi:SAM-dependent methyltransferase